MKQYTQITSEQRYTIGVLKTQGFSNAEIGDAIGKHRSTIWRELKRNTCNDGSYRYIKAARRTRGRRSRSRRNSQFDQRTWNSIILMITKKLSPDQISMERLETGMKQISHETIYRFLRRDRKQGGLLWKHLRYSGKQRKSRTGIKKTRLPEKRYIDERPESANNASEIGHIEIDTIRGRGSVACALTAVDRKSKFIWIVPMKNGTNAECNRAMAVLIRKAKGRIKTITPDNGTEFTAYKKIERGAGVKFYFAKPYSPWERGLNEHSNGLIRTYLPKTESMEGLTQIEANWIAKQINSRRRRSLNRKSPEMVFYGK